MQRSERIVRYSAAELDAMLARGEDLTDYAYLDAMTEEELEASIDHEEEGHVDLDSGRGLAKPDRPRPESVSIDDDLHAWYKGEGDDYVSLINTILRRWKVAHPRPDATDAPVDVAAAEAGAAATAGEAA